MSTMKLYTTGAEIDAACVKFHKAGQRLQSEAHKLACSVLRHIGEHGDIRVIYKFVASFSEAHRINAVRAWLEEFGPVAFETGDKPVFVKGKKTRLGEAMDKPFWLFKKEEAYKPIDPAAALETLIKRLVKDAKVTQRDHSALIQSLRSARVNGATVTTQEAGLQVVPATVEAPAMVQ